jgi:hypothetical protein
MGISLRPYINGREMGARDRSCDGKSLADYYLSAANNDWDLPGSRKRMNVIKVDFVKKVQIDDECNSIIDKPNIEIIEAWKTFDSYVVADGKPGECKTDPRGLQNAIIVIRAFIERNGSNCFDILGNSLEEVRDGAVADCNDMAKAVSMAIKLNADIEIYLQ